MIHESPYDQREADAADEDLRQRRADEADEAFNERRQLGRDAVLRNCFRGDTKAVALWNQICDDHDSTQAEWVDGLRSAGFKAAHPNDGWVDRMTNELHFVYPQFNDGAGIGDAVMLGWPSDKKSWRPVRLIGVRKTALGMVWWKFEDDLTNNESRGE